MSLHPSHIKVSNMAGEQQPSRITPNNVVGVIALLLVAAGVVYWAVNYAIEHSPLPAPTDHRQALANLVTPRFRNMSEARKVEYVMQTSALLEGMPMEVRRELFAQMNIPQETRNQIWVAREFNNAVRFAQAASDQEKNKILDVQIYRMLRMRARRLMLQPPEQAGDGPEGGDGRVGFRSLDEMRAQARAQIISSFESGNPQQARLNAEYRRALAERMAQREISQSEQSPSRQP